MEALLGSAPSCAICAVVLKGWTESREMVIANSLVEGMFDADDPPPDLYAALPDIAAYWTARRGVKLEVTRKAKSVAIHDGGDQGDRHTVLLRAECQASARSSGDAHDPLLAELRIVMRGDEGVAMDRNTSSLSIWRPSEKTKQAGVSSPYVSDTLLSANPLSQISLNVARRWLKTCLETHGSACSVAYAAAEPMWRRMPTRVLEIVSGSTKIYLREPQEHKLTDPRYVALSHCWGQDGTPFTTTHSTLASRKEGIEIAALPQTFRDSLVLSASLGLQYIWIDSLCIIQDDIGDWEAQSAQMASIYRNAYLVLGAANGSSDTMGFLDPREIQELVRLPWRNYGLALQLLPAEGRRWTDSAGPDPLAREPTNARAWCLQERQLPMRALYYGTRQMFWECERMRASEDGDAAAQEGSHLERLCATGNIAGSVFSRPQRSPYEEKRGANWVDWYAMIENYTSRSITKHTDRLPALSGLAQAVTAATRDVYIAGMWKAGLLEGLLWCRTQLGQILCTTADYVAPSWSWASVIGPVQFPVYGWYMNRAQWKAKMSDFEALAEYVSHLTEQKDLDEFGQLKGGYLTLKAPLVPVASIKPRQIETPLIQNLFGQEPLRSVVGDVVLEIQAGEGALTQDMWIEGGLDRPEEGDVSENGRLSVVFLTRLPYVLEDGWIEHRFGLIVQKLDDGQYRRVGFVDGFILGRVEGETLGIVGYLREPKEGDLDEEERPNNLARDPLGLNKSEITIG
ncbi:heterokaryon incompatibility protein-domain-containing protein [Podospora didyma]|uniref:Heterokaryon incompatibility protein-domain-containing protein n=1 Tax=Podospora didyma TaxID=330526 RepID=A0AAE0U705_9PEZI|nr:heterokaryon incompatibility protein-domain-containing protein [Podospora didyma]